jgi:DNA-binding NarL/FixJ family response regulator
MSETYTLRVMLVEDHIAFRQALAFLLRREPDLEVIAQAGSLAQAREMLDRRILVVVLTATIEAGHQDDRGSWLPRTSYRRRS